MNYITIFVNHKQLSVFSLGFIILLIGILQLNLTFATSKVNDASNITLYYISTRDPVNSRILDPLNPIYISKAEPEYGNDQYLDFNQFRQRACDNETVVIFVHGWEESEKIVTERLNRVKLSLANNSYTGPLVGFSWPSDTVWLGLKFIAKANGPKLAQLIYDVRK